MSRRWQRNTSISFLSNPSRPKQHQQQLGGGGKGMVQMIESGGIDPSVATMLQNPSLAASKPNFNFAAFSSDTKRVRASAMPAHGHITWTHHVASLANVASEVQHGLDRVTL